MPQIFGPRANFASRLTVPGALLLIAVVLGFGYWYVRSPLSTGEGSQPEQPVLFSHALHAGDLGLGCQYCHSTVETQAFAGMPPTQTCMNCHSQILTESPLLEPVRDSWRTGEPLRWARVHDLADFAYFDHSAHVVNGIGCATCHGRVDEMTTAEQVAPLTMGWCLECHRDPARFVRPPDRVFDMDYEPPEDQEALGRELVEELGIQVKTSCSTCHR